MNTYIIKNDQIVAACDDSFKSGQKVEFGSHWVSESMNANFDKILVGRQSGRISKAKKWDQLITRTGAIPAYASVLDPYYPNDLLVSSDEND